MSALLIAIGLFADEFVEPIVQAEERGIGPAEMKIKGAFAPRLQRRDGAARKSQ